MNIHSKVRGNPENVRKSLAKTDSLNIIGEMPKQKIVPTSQCVPFGRNRDTKLTWAKKSIADEGGFNWNLFGSIEGIPNKQTGEIEIWDGLGRLAIAQLCDIPEIPVIIHSEGSPGALFVKKQKLRNRSLSANDHAVALYDAYLKRELDNETHHTIRKEVAALEYCNVRVASGEETWMPESVRKDRPTISINAVRNGIKITKEPYFAEIGKLAVDTITNAYGTDCEIGKELFEGLCLIFRAAPKAGTNGCYQSLKDFLAAQAMNYTQRKLPFKQLGGNRHNHEARSVAVGLLSLWRDSVYWKDGYSNCITTKALEEYKW